jgi:hypothetical protein
MIKIWDKFDRWLCKSLPGPVRFRWAKLWVRKDEFHPSLNSDAEYAYSLTNEKREAYWKNLLYRRNSAHGRDVANERRITTTTA